MCNLACTWCDTDFRAEGAARMTSLEIQGELLRLDVHQARMVVVTGGEPALQWDTELYDRLHEAGFRCHMETNGTRPLLGSVDWLTVSPKPQFHPEGEQLALMRGDECKLIVDESVRDSDLENWAKSDFSAYFLQPCMDERYSENLARSIELCARHPRWRLSLQLHKLLGLP